MTTTILKLAVGYKVDVQGVQVRVFDQAGTIVISIFGTTSNPQNRSANVQLLFILEDQTHGNYTA
jgi:hypothetical protein